VESSPTIVLWIDVGARERYQPGSLPGFVYVLRVAFSHSVYAYVPPSPLTSTSGLLPLSLKGYLQAHASHTALMCEQISPFVLQPWGGRARSP
jgi:hypothetical protein